MCLEAKPDAHCKMQTWGCLQPTLERHIVCTRTPTPGQKAQEAFVFAHDPQRCRHPLQVVPRRAGRPGGDRRDHLGRARWRGPRRMRGPGAYLVRRVRRNKTSSNRAAARARPRGLSSCGSHGSGEKRPMPADASSAVWMARGCGDSGGLSLSLSPSRGGVAGDSAAGGRSGSEPGRLAWPRLRLECHRGPPGRVSKFPDSPPPAHPPPTRTAPLDCRLPPAASGKRRAGPPGQEEGPKKRGKGLGLPEHQPPKA